MPRFITLGLALGLTLTTLNLGIQATEAAVDAAVAASDRNARTCAMVNETLPGSCTMEGN